MNKYEILFILDNAAADEAKEAMIAKMTSLISENGGNVETEDVPVEEPTDEVETEIKEEGKEEDDDHSDDWGMGWQPI